MDDNYDLRREMCEIARRMFARRLVSGTSGNISVRMSNPAEIFLIKASGKSFEDINEEDFVLVGFDGEILSGNGVPSIEMAFHRNIYRVRPDVMAVVHGHSPYATAYVMATGQLPLVTLEAQLCLKHIGVVPYADPGSEELAAMVSDVFRRADVRAVVLNDHGFITVAESLKAAYYLADTLEENAKVAYLLRSLSNNSQPTQFA
jgi:L-fuculose-phosphate aldolase